MKTKEGNLMRVNEVFLERLLMFVFCVIVFDEKDEGKNWGIVSCIGSFVEFCEGWMGWWKRREGFR